MVEEHSIPSTLSAGMVSKIVKHTDSRSGIKSTRGTMRRHVLSTAVALINMNYKYNLN